MDYHYKNTKNSSPETKDLSYNYYKQEYSPITNFHTHDEGNII